MRSHNMCCHVLNPVGIPCLDSTNTVALSSAPEQLVSSIMLATIIDVFVSVCNAVLLIKMQDPVSLSKKKQ